MGPGYFQPLIETSALDATNVEEAFFKILDQIYTEMHRSQLRDVNCVNPPDSPGEHVSLNNVPMTGLHTGGIRGGCC
eukprot:g10498.t1